MSVLQTYLLNRTLHWLIRSKTYDRWTIIVPSNLVAAAAWVILVLGTPYYAPLVSLSKLPLFFLIGPAVWFALDVRRKAFSSVEPRVARLCAGAFGLSFVCAWMTPWALLASSIPLGLGALAAFIGAAWFWSRSQESFAQDMAAD